MAQWLGVVYLDWVRLGATGWTGWGRGEWDLQAWKPAAQQVCLPAGQAGKPATRGERSVDERSGLAESGNSATLEDADGLRPEFGPFFPD